MPAKNLGRTWSLAVALLLCAATVLMMGAYGGSEKAYVDRDVVKYGGSSISATNPVSLYDTTLYSDAFSLEHSSCFSAIITITNASSASATINLQVYDQGTSTWCDRYSTAGASDPFVFMSAVPAGTLMWIPISSLPVGNLFRFKFNNDATSDVYKVTRLVMLHQ